MVKVRVLEVDVARKRIALTMRMSDPVEKRPPGPRSDERAAFQRYAEKKPAGSKETPGGALADALRRAGLSDKRR